MDRRKFLVTGMTAAAAAVFPVGSVLAATAPEPAIKYLIIPDIMRIQRQTEVVDEVNNWRTIVYEVMDRWTIEDGKFKTLEVALVGSDRYADWLLESPPANGIPPHIGFGGCIVASKVGDPTFKSRWDDAARRDYGIKV